MDAISSGPTEPRTSDGFGWRALDLRTHVRRLEELGELTRIEEPVSIRNVGKIVEAHDQALLFTSVTGYSMPLLANVMATRRRWSEALVCEPMALVEEVKRRSAARVAPAMVETGPVKEVVRVGSDATLSDLPAYLQHDRDGAPYISAALDVTKHPESGHFNIGVRRLMLRGTRETGVDVVAPSDMRASYRRAREIGKRFEIAFVVGTYASDYLATQMKVPTANEFETMGAFRGAPVPLVACETVDLLVPADAEIVLEGYLEGDWTEVEGPFGEYTGCYGAAHRNPVFHLSAITRRSDAVFQTATIGGRRLQHTDTAVITAIKTEMLVRDALERTVANPLEVYCPPAATGLHHARVKIRTRDPGDGRNAAVGVLASNADVKMAIVVDEDIDIFDDASVEWAISTRFQADSDMVLLPNMRTFPLDPSLPPHAGSNVTTAKVGIDATRPYNRPAHAFAIPAAAFEREPVNTFSDERSANLEELTGRMLESLGNGPRFVDWLAAESAVPQSQILEALGRLRDRGSVEMDLEGRYWPKARDVESG